MKIPETVKKQIEDMIESFNNNRLRHLGCYYLTRYKGSYLYLDRYESECDSTEPICRLKYNGQMNDWDFAIFKYSSERYATDEAFQSDNLFDGTVEGAMKAGLKAYPL